VDEKRPKCRRRGHKFAGSANSGMRKLDSTTKSIIEIATQIVQDMKLERRVY
jgi:regulator of PEP synthase PpsR (kinase-PPPase family)